MHAPARDSVFKCVTCEMEIHGLPVVHVGLPFCCAGCVVGGPCTCSYDEEAIDAQPSPALPEPEPSLAHDVLRVGGARG